MAVDDRPGLDVELLAELERLTAAVPGVRGALAVTRQQLSPALGRELGRGWSSLGTTLAGPRTGAGSEAERTDGAPGGAAGRLAVADGGLLERGPEYPETVQAALRRAAGDAEGRGITYVRPDGSADVQTYAELVAAAQRVLGGLRAAGVQPGHPVLLQLDDARSFLTAFWACVLGGFLPTPAGVAPDYAADGAATRRLHSAWRLLGRPLIVTDAGLQPAIADLGRRWGDRAVVVEAIEELGGGEEDGAWHPVSAEDPVLHLLTSGSTGVPKCVRHRNRSIAALARAWQLVHGFDERDVTLNWMPLDHVGAIVMYHVRSVFQGSHHVCARPDAVLANPLRWLDWISEHRVTDTWAPNFAFALVNERERELRRGSWDLSSVRFLLNGGEAVVSRTAHRFLQLLAPHGLGAGVMRPAWGMSETSSGVTFSRLSGEDPSAGVRIVDQRSLTGDLRFLDAPSGSSVTFTEVGGPVPGVQLRIVDDADAVLPEDRVGRLQVAGETLMDGYVDNPDSFTEDGWFETGDLAFLHDGSLVITGRDEDVIVVNGANHLSYDVEAALERVDGVEATWAAAVGIFDPDRGGDRLAVFFVPTSADREAQRQVVREIRTVLGQELGLQPDAVVPLDRAEFPKTASGKIQRASLRTALTEGAFDARVRELDPDEREDGELPAWFFEPVWREAPAPPLAGTRSLEGVTLVLSAGDAEYTSDLGERLQQVGGELVAVWQGEPGTELRLRPDGGYEMDPSSPSQYAELLADVERRVGRVRRLLHSWAAVPWRAAAPWAAESPADLAPYLVSGLYSILWLLQAAAARGWTDADLLVITQGAYVADPEDRLDPRKGGIPGLVRTAAAEELVRSARHVDHEPVAESWRWADLAFAELAGGDEPVVARRGSERYALRLRMVGAPAASGPAIAAGGLYLVTGGLGGVGFELAQYLLAAYGVRLLIVGRTPESESEEVRSRVGELAELGDVRYVQANVADRAAVSGAVVEAEQACGVPLAGVLHLAGTLPSGGWDALDRHLLRVETREEVERVLEAKLYGTYALAHVLRERPDAELVLFSSLNGLFGGASFGAYAAANSFLDAFATRWATREQRPVHCLAWSMWPGIGMNRDNPTVDAARRRGFRSIDVSQGLASFQGALGLDRPYLAIGLDPRSPDVLPELDAEQLDAEVVVAFEAGSDGGVAVADLERETSEARARLGGRVSFRRLGALPRGPSGEVDREAVLPLLDGGSARAMPFEEPQSSLERAVADTFREVLGASQVGRHDSFFGLHGNSVRAAQVMARLNARLGANHALRTLYRHPTVRELAVALG